MTQGDLTDKGLAHDSLVLDDHAVLRRDAELVRGHQEQVGGRRSVSETRRRERTLTRASRSSL